MQHFKIRKNDVVFLVSGLFFIALAMVPNKAGVLVALVELFVLLPCYFWLRSQEKPSGGTRLFSVLCAVLVCAFSAEAFAANWKDSSKVAAVAAWLGVSSVQLLMVCACVLFVPALYFAARGIELLAGLSKQPGKEIPALENRLNGKVFYAICLAAAVCGVGLQIYAAFGEGVWVDEAFSLALILHPYGEVVSLTAQDVHPPLYYLILKFVVDAAQTLFPGSSAIVSAKLVSVVPFALLLLLAVTKVRKRWGNFVSGMFCVCLIGMPHLIAYGVEIRMYSWALFFVTWSFLCVCDIADMGKSRAWVLFVVSSLMASYTHYFACVAAAFGYLALLVYFARRRDKAALKRWLVASALTVAGYFPWLLVLLQQLRKVSADYWIEKITWDTLKSYLLYPFSNGTAWMEVLAVALLAAVGIIFARALNWSVQNKNSWKSFSIIGGGGGTFHGQSLSE